MAGDCIEWQHARGPMGYGYMSHPGVISGSRLAHREALARKLGRPVQGVARHTCDNPPCINPEHLLEGTQSDNIKDSVERGRFHSRFSDATHCIHGHEFTPENTRLSPNKIVKSGFQRVCLTCRRDRAEAKRAETKRSK